VRTIGAGGTVSVGAVAVSMPATRLNGTLDRSPALTRAAERIALELAH
jgi:hypothetical protein